MGTSDKANETPSASIKAASKIPSSIKRPTRKKPKDKPKRPLSAYNFFFKEEREKILKVIHNEDPEETKRLNGDPDDPGHISEELLKRLRKEDGKVSFEEMGKLIGQRWKTIDPDRHAKYSEMATEDTERYKKEMQTYNGRQEAKMRSEALKPPAWASSMDDGKRGNASHTSMANAYKEAMAMNTARSAAAAAAAANGASGYGSMQGFDPSMAAAAAAGYPYGGMDMQSLYAMQMGMYGGGAYGAAAGAGGYGGMGAGAAGGMAAMYAQQMAAMGGYGGGAGMMGGYGGYGVGAGNQGMGGSAAAGGGDQSGAGAQAAGGYSQDPMDAAAAANAAPGSGYGAAPQQGAAAPGPAGGEGQGGYPQDPSHQWGATGGQ